ncbi:MAG: PhnD/SsuA/transferrin family substrate-binding protein [Rubricella sp.]
MRASLPMYDWPEIAGETDAAWAALSPILRARGIAAPDGLDRTGGFGAHWPAPDLCLSMACGLDVAEGRTAPSRTVARPVWRFRAWPAGTYRSALVTRMAEAAKPLATLARRPVINMAESWSGAACLERHLAGRDIALGRPHVSGSHRASLECIRQGDADLAAIDGVSLALAARFDGIDDIAILGWTAPAAATPMIAGAALDPARVLAALHRWERTDAFRSWADAIGLTGFMPASETDYGSMSKPLPHGFIFRQETVT